LSLRSLRRSTVDLDGSVCVVAGAVSGIGAALVRQLLTLGAAGVVACDRDAAGARRLASAGEGRLVTLSGDVLAPKTYLVAVALAERRSGRLDLYCPNAGVLSMGVALDRDDWQRHWEVKVLAHPTRTGGRSSLDAGVGVGPTAPGGVGRWTHAHARRASTQRWHWPSGSMPPTGTAGRGVERSSLRGRDPADERRSVATGASAADEVVVLEEVAIASLEAVVNERFPVVPQLEVADPIQRRGADVDGWVKLMSERQAQLEAANR
jgi:NAD(P)-dependent dehydrogenase (short-subunit alcohol dehydrogenase family)